MATAADGKMAAPARLSTVMQQLGLTEEQVEPCGWYKGKLALGLEYELANRPLAKYIGVTAINPTPLGEGKTITAIGLAMGLSRIGRRTVVTIRQPSLGPLFGIKGGGAGGGRSCLVPSHEINLHLTGDIHAVSAAANLLAALIDNHIRRGKSPTIVPASVTWRRAIDICDRSLRELTLDTNATDGLRVNTAFEMTAASEVMAVLSLATSLADLRRRLGQIVIGRAPDGAPVRAEELQAAGAMAAILRDALRPNLVQTCEQTPALVHTGPFGNIAHGNSSVLADLMAVRLADFVVTESGFGVDCGAEKFFDIKCRVSGLRPDVEVLVCTARALKLHSGRFRVRPGQPLPPELLAEDLPALQAGSENLQAHLDILRQFGVPVVVAINRFPGDSDRELATIESLARQAGAKAVAVSEVFARGGAGGIELAQAVVDVSREPSNFRFLYPCDAAPADKIETIATQVYGADGVDWQPGTAEQLRWLSTHGFDPLPVCIAKTAYSLSHDPKQLGRPRGFRLPIREVRLAAGAGYLYAMAGDITTMPGLPAVPAASRIDLDAHGNILGLT